MSQPRRVQLRREKGWRMPPNTISVARPTRWGNPFIVGETGLHFRGNVDGDVGRYGERLGLLADVPLKMGLTPELAVALYEQELDYSLSYDGITIFGQIAPGDKARVDELRAALAALRGHNLACWCPLALPCHADVLLRRANR